MLSFISAVGELTLVSPSEEAPVTFGPVGDALGGWELFSADRAAFLQPCRQKHKCPGLQGTQRAWTPPRHLSVGSQVQREEMTCSGSLKWSEPEHRVPGSWALCSPLGAGSTLTSWTLLQEVCI